MSYHHVPTCEHISIGLFSEVSFQMRPEASRRKGRQVQRPMRSQVTAGSGTKQSVVRTAMGGVPES